MFVLYLDEFEMFFLNLDIVELRYYYQVGVIPMLF